MMRYIVSLACLLAALMASPQSAGAQVDQGGTSSRPRGAAFFAQNLGPPQFMLRASYYLYLDADADNGDMSDQAAPKAEESKSAQADGEVAASEPNLEEPVSFSEPGTEVPDIDTLSQRAIEHYDIQYATRSGRGGGTGGRSRGAKAGIAVGVIVGVGLVGVAIGAAVAMSNWKFEL